MPAVYRVDLPRRLANALITPLIRLGVAPADAYLLTTVGRKTGRRYAIAASPRSAFTSA